MPNPVSSKHILTLILNPLSTIDTENEPREVSSTATSPLSHHTILSALPDSSRQQAKSVLLTLHFFFPHELLPALDLIDRRLITQLSTTSIPSETQAEPASSSDTESITVFYVQSASSTTSAQSHGRFRNALSKSNQFYEVRLDGWNCTCPAFAYSTLRLLMKGLRSRTHTGNEREHVTAGTSDVEKRDDNVQAQSNDVEWHFGGSATKDDATIPICKHILAVTLVNSAPRLFGRGMVHRDVSREEFAGWAAGWGEH